jgi:hypothetical protein
VPQIVSTLRLRGKSDDQEKRLHLAHPTMLKLLSQAVSGRP